MTAFWFPISCTILNFVKQIETIKPSSEWCVKPCMRIGFCDALRGSGNAQTVETLKYETTVATVPFPFLLKKPIRCDSQFADRRFGST